MKLRGYQEDASKDVDVTWENGATNVMVVMPTGGGKTVLFTHKMANNDGASIAIAHRKELVGQMSVALGRWGLQHRIIAPDETIGEIVGLHSYLLGKNYHHPAAPIAVAGVDTLVRRDLGDFAQQVSLWVQDEGHHLLRCNKWGRAVNLFPNARGMAVTGSPVRADGKGLGRHADGLMDALVLGPSTRDLIDQGYLADYRLFSPTSDIDLSNVSISEATGDYNPQALRDAANKSHIVGDVVQGYLDNARGKLGVTFCVSVDIAQRTAQQYRDAGIPAECVSAGTPSLARAMILRRFANREILQLVNVDLFGEGFDLPAIEVVSMARPTESLALYLQQAGRALRPMDGKDRAILIDHVGNWVRHQIPDVPREWTLDRRPKRASRKKDDDVVPMRVCVGCTGVYERVKVVCPYCGHKHEPASRGTPKHVDGDLTELDPQVLRALRGQVQRADDMPRIPYGAEPEVVGAIKKRHRRQQAAQGALRVQIAWWAGWQRSLGRDDAEGYRRFYVDFGTDVLTAQTLNESDAVALCARIREHLTSAGVFITPQVQAA